MAKVGKNVTFTCHTEAAPVWHFVGKKVVKNNDIDVFQWKQVPYNTEVSKGNGTQGYDLKVTKVINANNGWYGCYGQHSDVHFLAIGYLEVKGK